MAPFCYIPLLRLVVVIALSLVKMETQSLITLRSTKGIQPR